MKKQLQPVDNDRNISTLAEIEDVDRRNESLHRQNAVSLAGEHSEARGRVRSGGYGYLDPLLLVYAKLVFEHLPNITVVSQGQTSETFRQIMNEQPSSRRVQCSSFNGDPFRELDSRKYYFRKSVHVIFHIDLDQTEIQTRKNASIVQV